MPWETEMTEGKTYSTRSAAVRAACEHCRRALNAPGYEAFEGPDFEIHPVASDDWRYSDYAGPSKYFLRGPAKEA